MGDVDNDPLTMKQVVGWGSATVAVISMIVSGVVTFCHIEGRCDLADQSIATMKSERADSTAARDKQLEVISNRQDAMEHNVSDLAHAITDMESSMAVMRSRQDDSLVLLKKIDDKVNSSPR